MENDYKIEVSPEIGKQIAQIICREIKESLDKNAKIYQLAERCENQYQQKTKWDVQNNGVCNIPWKGASNYFVALTEWIVDAVWARLMNILFSQQPYMKAHGVESSDISRQDGVTDFTDMTLREKVKLYENSNFFFKQMIKLPFAVLKFCWVQEYDTMITKEQAMIFTNPATGDIQRLLPDDPNAQIAQAEFAVNGYQPTGQEDVWVTEDVELINAPQIKYIKFADYVFSPIAKRGQKLYWEGDRFWLTANDMRLKKNQGRFIPDSVDKTLSTRKDQKTGVDAIVSDRQTPIECFNWYGRFPFNKNNEIDFQDPEAIEQEVVCVVAFKEEELLEIDRWYYHRKPWPDRVYIRGEFEETENFEGRSMCEKLYKTQSELNDFHKTLMDNAWLAMQKIFVKKRTLTGDDWERPIVAPGEIWEEDMQGDIRVLEVGDVKAIGLELEQMLLNFAERISNITNWNLGTNKAEGGKSTATEFAGVMQEGNIGREPLLQRCYNILKTICQWNLDYYSERMPEGLERRILGESGEPIFPTQENMPVYAQQGVNPTWSKEDLAGQFDFTWQGSSQNSDIQWNIMVSNDVMDRYLPQPMVQGNMLAVWNILKDGLVARKKDWQKILPPQQAIIDEMKRMQAEAQARNQMQEQAGQDQAMQNKLGQKIDTASKVEDLKAKIQANQMGAVGA